MTLCRVRQLVIAFIGTGLALCVAACSGMSKSRRDVVRVLGEPDIVMAAAGDLGVYLAPHEPLPSGWKIHTVTLYYLDIHLEIAVRADGAIEKTPMSVETESHLRPMVREPKSE